MTKSELIEKLTNQQNNFSKKIIKNIIKELLDYIINVLANGERIEIRDFGSFTLHYRAQHFGRNPKTGNKVLIKSKYVPYFKPGKTLREYIKNKN